MKQLSVAALAVIGLGFLALALYYLKTPAGSLPHFVPGYEAGVTTTHTKHALAALVVAIGCGVLAWFVSGSSTATPTSPENTPKV